MTELATLLFPQVNKTPEDYEALYPPRELPLGAKVTRLGPSPTGFIHLGNLYGALADERLAHQSGGLFLLRVEDTDDKRETPGAVEAVIRALNYFDVNFDEGAGVTGDRGSYGPYRQRERAELYQTIAGSLVSKGLAYPCFCTEAELAAIRDEQEKTGVTKGIYGEWAPHRHLSTPEIAERLTRGEPFVIRLRAPENPARCRLTDGIRGKLDMPGNEQDIVLLKTNGIPTYHFAHVVDDHFMRITHILRGEEWLSSLPIHIQLFDLLAWEKPVFCHTSLLMKLENGAKRKLSKRKDPELSLDYYLKAGYHPQAVREYLLTILNSDYEEWRLANPGAPQTDFPFSLAKMGGAGALFDLDKLNDVSKNVLATLKAEEIATFLRTWSQAEQPEIAPYFADEAYLAAICEVGRRGEKPRKDLAFGEQIFPAISFFFDELFTIHSSLPENIDETLARSLLSAYLETYDQGDDKDTWFAKVRELAVSFGFAAKPKDFKKNPEAYKGHVGDISAVIRLALTGRENSPDLWEVQQVLGENRARARLLKFP